MRVRALATCVHLPARLPSVRTAPTLHAHHATSWPSPCTTLTLFCLAFWQIFLRPKYRKHVGFTPEKKYDPVD